jgi:hypothetical protein
MYCRDDDLKCGIERTGSVFRNVKRKIVVTGILEFDFELFIDVSLVLM